MSAQAVHRPGNDPSDTQPAAAGHEYHLRPPGALEFGELDTPVHTPSGALQASDVQAMKQWHRALTVLRRVLSGGRD